MKFKKHLLFLCLIMVIFTIASVSASDVNDTVIASEASSDIIASEANNDVIAIDDAENEDIGASDDDAIADSPKTFQDLIDTFNNAQNDTITLNDDYASTDSSLFDGIEISRSLTIDGQGHTLDGGGNKRFFNVTGGTVIFKNIIFKNGYAGSGENNHGGAIKNYNAQSVTVINCTFDNNRVLHDGGALYNVIAINCTFKNNHAAVNGGAMYSGSAENCNFSNNDATQGGAMCNGKAVNCTFDKNWASYQNAYIAGGGGAMCNGTATNCNFSGNNVTHKYGGATYNANVENCYFINNYAAHGGAMRSGTAINCTFVSNRESNGRYAMDECTVKNCTFINNTAKNTDIFFDVLNPVVALGDKIYFKYLPTCNIKVSVDDKTFTANNDGWNVNNLDIGIHTVRFDIQSESSTGSNSGSLTKEITVRYNLGLNVNAEDIFIGQSAVVNVSTNSTFNGDVIVAVNGANYTINVNNGAGTHAFNGLSLGNYTVAASFGGDDTFGPAEYTTKFEVKRYDLNLTVDVEDIFVGQSTTVNINTNNTFTGEVALAINDTNYTVSINEGSGSHILTDLKAGNYTVTAKFDGDDTLAPAEYTAKFEVKRYDLDLTVDVEDIFAGQSTTVNINTNNTFTGEVALAINDTNYTVSINEGSGSHILTDLKAGNYTVTARFEENDKFNPDEKSATLEVKPASEMIDVVVPDSDTPEFTINLPSDATGNLTVTINGENHTASLVNGSASITVPGLSDGTYNATISYSGDDKYPAVTKNTTVTVKNPVYKISNNKDVTMLYTAKTPYKVLITRNGKAVAGVKVTFKFNGKTYTRTTDKNGYATLNLPDVKPKKTKYTVTATYNGITVTNKVKVNSIIKAANKKVKKSKKVTKIKVSLKKVNGKYLKAKTLKIKFKGKTYKVKTNKKGVATWKVKKSMVKKLKVGKKYKYKVTYGKDTVTKKLTIKK